MSDLSNPIFHDEAKAREWLEGRLWPEGPICPHCGVVGQATLMQGGSHRPGLYNCNACREPFTVTVNTLYERSKVPLHKWLAATHLMMASKKGMSALQIGRMLALSKKTAWFLCHRIRESLRETNPGLLGGDGSTVEADGTFVGGKDKTKHASTRKSKGGMDKEPVFALWVNHGIDEYVRGNAHTNTIEGSFSIRKRGIHGVYHHVSQRHLAEYDFRYNEREALGVSDTARMAKSVNGIVGKRLYYKMPW
jgi:transposase-like protein